MSTMVCRLTRHAALVRSKGSRSCGPNTPEKDECDGSRRWMGDRHARGTAFGRPAFSPPPLVMSSAPGSRATNGPAGSTLPAIGGSAGDVGLRPPRFCPRSYCRCADRPEQSPRLATLVSTLVRRPRAKRTGGRVTATPRPCQGVRMDRGSEPGVDRDGDDHFDGEALVGALLGDQVGVQEVQASGEVLLL